jgi:hypothetical protein
MNNVQIEEVLRKAPAPKAPTGLLQKLTADIRVPRTEANPIPNWSSPSSWARRWLPALSFAGIFLAGLVAVAVQTNILGGLDRENQALRATQANLETLRADNAEYQKLLVESQQLDRLRKDNAELQKLRAEVTQLSAQLVEAPKLQAANQQLAASLAQAGSASGTNDFFAEAKARAESIQCANNLKQIGLAARLWAGDNKDIYPMNFICMTNELSTWKVLQCPSDKSHNVTNWADVAVGNISYLMDTPGILEGGPDYSPNIVFAECRVHHNICLMDGSVQRLSEKGYEHVKVINGKKVMVP